MDKGLGCTEKRLHIIPEESVTLSTTVGIKG